MIWTVSHVHPTQLPVDEQHKPTIHVVFIVQETQRHYFKISQVDFKLIKRVKSKVYKKSNTIRKGENLSYKFLYLSIFSKLNLRCNCIVECKKGHYAKFNSTDLVECIKCEVDSYQETDSRNTSCVECPEGANTDGQIGSIECGIHSFTSVWLWIKLTDSQFLSGATPT